MANKQTTVNEEDLEREDLEEEEIDEREEEEGEEEEVEEETEAAASLKPGSKSLNDPKSKIEVMKSVLGAVAGAKGEALGYWEKALAAVPKHGAGVPGGNEAHNKDSISASPSDAVGHKDGAGTYKDAVKEAVREDLQHVFESDKTLTEEAKERLETIFEAAVTARVLIAREEMEESFGEQFNESVEEVKKEIEDQLNSYLQYCTENWMAENEVAVESALRSELTEEFMDGLKQLFAEHFIDIPESKSDVIEALSEKVEELENVLTQVIDENNELKGLNIEAELSDAIGEIAQGLTVSQTEKLAALSEDVEFDGDIDNFKKKVGIIKETYFGANGQKPEREEDDFEKSDNELNEEEKVIADPAMRRYAETIKNTVKEDLRVK